jgi:hypothetical protein
VRLFSVACEITSIFASRLKEGQKRSSSTIPLEMEGFGGEGGMERGDFVVNKRESRD